MAGVKRYIVDYYEAYEYERGPLVAYTDYAALRESHRELLDNCKGYLANDSSQGTYDSSQMIKYRALLFAAIARAEMFSKS
jgi:hypothetical protein